MEKHGNNKGTGTCRGPIDDLASVIRWFGYCLPGRFGVDEYVPTLESRHTPVMFRLEYERVRNQLFLFPWVRSSSWQFDGERSDIHDIASIAFAAAVAGDLDLPASSNYMAGLCGPMDMDTVFISIHQSRSRGFADDDCGLFEITRIIGCAYSSWMSIQECPRESAG